MQLPKNISKEDVRACKALFESDPDLVKKLTKYPDPIGRIAKLCIEAGQVV